MFITSYLAREVLFARLPCLAAISLLTNVQGSQGYERRSKENRKLKGENHANHVWKQIWKPTAKGKYTNKWKEKKEKQKGTKKEPHTSKENEKWNTHRGTQAKNNRTRKHISKKVSTRSRLTTSGKARRHLKAQHHLEEPSKRTCKDKGYQWLLSVSFAG